MYTRLRHTHSAKQINIKGDKKVLTIQRFMLIQGKVSRLCIWSLRDYSFKNIDINPTFVILSMSTYRRRAGIFFFFFSQLLLPRVCAFKTKNPTLPLLGREALTWEHETVMMPNVNDSGHAADLCGILSGKDLIVYFPLSP